MSDEVFKKFADCMGKYLRETKVFMKNPRRIADVEKAMEMAYKLFPEATITIADDPLQIGTMFLRIRDFDLAVREIKNFEQLISKADGFEIYPVDKEDVIISLMFNNALIRISK